MSEPLVSVLIPVYNHAQYVRQCLNSLLTEGWPNLEVLVIDDGSSDNSFEVVQEWREEHPNAFIRFDATRQQNKGLARTLNSLVSKARGKFVTLLASDDYLLDGGIATRVNFLLRNAHLLGVFGDSIAVDSDNHKISNSALTTLYRVSARPAALLCPSLIGLELITRWSVPGPGLLLRRHAFDPSAGVGSYDETLGVEDRDFYLRLLARRALGFVGQQVAAYRWHRNNTVNASVERKARQYGDLARAARKAAHSFYGIERLALFVDVKRQETALKRLSVMGIGCRLAWVLILLIQNARLAYYGVRGGVA